jgi:hypothetical protein
MPEALEVSMVASVAGALPDGRIIRNRPSARRTTAPRWRPWSAAGFAFALAR